MKNLRWVFLGLLLGARALADVPTKIGYQGLLLRTDGTPERGLISIRFSLHDAESEGSELWNETQTLLLTEGSYMTQLGELTPLPATAFDAPTRFLQLTVGGTALQPRLRFGAVPFALIAGGVSGGSVNASSVKVNGTPVVAINTAGGCNGGDVARWNGSSWACGAPVTAGDGGTISYATQAGGGLELNSGNAFSLLRSCARDEVLRWNFGTSAWVCSSARSSLGACSDGEVLTFSSGTMTWGCAARGVASITASAPLIVGGTSSTPTITLSTVPLSRGGTGADLSATGGTGQVVKQSGAGAVLTVGALTASELPAHTHSASDLTTGTLAQARGGTGLSSAPADGTFLRSAAGTWAAASILASDLPPGNASYIQNQTAGDQPASFQINGSGSIGTYLTAGNAIIGPWTISPNAVLVVNSGSSTPAVRIGYSAPLYLNSALPSVTFNGRADATGTNLQSEGGYVAQLIHNSVSGSLEFWSSSTSGAAGATLPRLKSLELLPSGVVPCSGSCEAGPTLNLTGGRLAVPWGFDISHYDGVSAKPILKKFWNGTDFDSLLLSSTSTSGSLQMAMVLNSGPGFVRFGRPLFNGEGLGSEFIRLAHNCVMDGAGSVIGGTCVSDARLKKDIRPLPASLDLLAALEPVSYLWRVEEFPERSFGPQREYGLIAQQVEQVWPELVAHDDQGFRAVKYERLPLLTLQAVRELKARDDARAQELRAARQRIDTLEREQRELVARLEAIEHALQATRPNH